MDGEEILNKVRFYTGNHDLQGFEEINDAYETLLRRAGLWVTRVRDEESLVFLDEKKTYTLPMEQIRRLESIWVKDNEDFQEWRKLKEATEDKFEKTVFSFRKEDGTDDKDVPSVYRLSMGASDQLEVTPTPDGTYSARLVYIGNPPAIDKSTVPILPENYHRIIAKKAAFNWLSMQPGEAEQLKANRMQAEVREAQLPMAFDISNNRSGLLRPRQKIMRA